jgi:hypothetical protein
MEKDRFEGDCRLELQFQASSGLQYTSSSRFPIVIRDSEAPQITFRMQPESVEAGESSAVKASLNRPAPFSIEIACKVHSKSIQGKYLKHSPGSVTIQRGQTEATIPIDTNPIGQFEGDRELQLKLQASGNVKFTGSNIVKLRILDPLAEGEAMVFLLSTDPQPQSEIADHLKALTANRKNLARLVGQAIFVVTPAKEDNWFRWDPKDPLVIPPAEKFTKPETRSVLNAAFRAYCGILSRLQRPPQSDKRMAAFIVWASKDSPGGMVGAGEKLDKPDERQEWYVYWLGPTAAEDTWLTDNLGGPGRVGPRVKYRKSDEDPVADSILGILDAKPKR